MKVKIAVVLSVLLIVAIATAPVHAQSDAPESPTIECDGEAAAIDIEESVSLFEGNTEAIPSVIKPVLPSNMTHLHVAGAENGDFAVALDEDLHVESVSIGEPEDPDVIVETDREMACEIVTADDHVEAFVQGYDNGDITVEATGTVGGAVLYVVELLNSLNPL